MSTSLKRLLMNSFCRHQVKQYAWRGYWTQRSSLPSILNVRNDQKQNSESRSTWPVYTGAALTTGLVLSWYLIDNKNHVSVCSLPSLPLLEAAEDEEKVRKVSLRERRYKDFASVMYHGEPYMTGRDFLEAVTKKAPRSFDPVFVDDKMLQKMIQGAPPRSKGSSHLFRDMWNNAILTYADYLFLLTALVKTKRQFEIAFKMIDADQNDYVDLDEFQKVQQSVTKQRDYALIQQQLSQSSLTVHLFGAKGNQKFYSRDFYKFIDDLQTEVLEIEYSGGTPTICAEDFARVLLKHTTWDLDPVFVRLKKRPRGEMGISFPQFKDFCQLLNSLDDFETAMAMYTIADTAVTEDEFRRAAKVCIGKSLDEAVVNTVFHIFDTDGDGKLSYREFMAVMKNWKLRGFKMMEHKKLGVWDEFKTCIKMEMRERA